MPHFVDDNTDLAYPKLKLRDVVSGSEDKYLRAVDWNGICQAAVDLRSSVLALRNVFTTSADGLVPAASGGSTTTQFLRKDGTWQVPGGSAFSGASVYSSGVQAVASGGSGLVVEYDSEEFDTATYHDNVTDNSRLTVAVTGYYRINARINFTANATGIRELDIVKNGATPLAIAKQLNPGGTQAAYLEATVIALLTASDYVTVTAFQNSGSSVNLTGAAFNSFQIQYLGS